MAKEAMTTYCRAQANINKVLKDTDERRKSLSERIRTYRSLLQDELTQRNISCVEWTPEGKNDPVYFRLKENSNTPTIDVEMIMTILRSTDNDSLILFADKNGHDLPKMLSAMLNVEIKKRYTKKTGKMSLSISNAKERGYSRQVTPKEVTQLASDLYTAREELTNLRNTDNKRKQAHIEEQREVEEEVKNSLRDKDPTNKMTRIHMMQDNEEWIYYLRCKEKEKTPNIGVRKIVPMVEDALAKALTSQGFGREYSAQFIPTTNFWDEVTQHLSTCLNNAMQNTKTISKLTLDRGAPRKRRTKQNLAN